tara:strand:+ start:336 stop:467 length:132 start_codon:yes stop_codon:yes gene_type:complete
MAKANIFKFKKNKQKKRPGIHSKNKSRTKGGPQYVKPYIGQGR